MRKLDKHDKLHYVLAAFTIVFLYVTIIIAL